MPTARPQFETGIHADIPAADYHAAEGVSNSGLKTFAVSPAHYAAALDGVPESDVTDPDEEDKGARLMGTLTHLAILEPERFGEGVSHHIKPLIYPDEKTGNPKKWTGAAKWCKAWLEEHAGLPCITVRESWRIEGARDAVRAHPVAGPMLAAKGVNEASVFARHPDTGLMLRCRPDRLTEDTEGQAWAFDLKTCPSVADFARSARQFRYDVQDTFYTDVLREAGVDARFAFVAVELVPRYGIHTVGVFMPDADTQFNAREIYTRELAEMVRCMESGVWPLRHTAIETLRVKRWVE